MDISTRSFLTAGISLTAAAAITIAPVVVNPPPVPAVVSDVRLTAVSDDIDVAIADLQAFLDAASLTIADVVGIPGRGLIGVAGGIETLFDVALTGWIDATSDPTAAASLTILRTLAVDAWAKLEENLGLINPAITGATEQVGKLVTGAFTGSLHNILTAGPNVLPAAAESAQLVIGNGLRVIQTVGDAGFDVAGIVVRELTFQLTNLLGGASALLTHLGEASGSPLIEAVLGVVRDFALTPVRAVVNTGSGLIQAGIATANAGFDVVLDVAINAVDPADPEPASDDVDRIAAESVEYSSDVDDEEAPAEVEESVEEEEAVEDEESAAEAPVEAAPEEAPAEEAPTDEAPTDADSTAAESEEKQEHSSKSRA